MVKGVYIKPDSFPANMTMLDWVSFRKIRRYSTVSSVHAKRVLLPENQIQPEQGPALLQMLQRRRDERNVLADLKSLRSLEEWKAKADRMEGQRKSKEAELAKRFASEAITDAETPEEPLAVVTVDEAGRDALQQYCVETPEAAPASSLPAPAKRRRAKKDVSATQAPSEVSGVPSGVSASKKGGPSSQGAKVMEAADDATIEEALAHDPPMIKVAKHLGVIHECLKVLSITKCMEGQKLGNQTFSAGALIAYSCFECSVCGCQCVMMC